MSGMPISMADSGPRPPHKHRGALSLVPEETSLERADHEAASTQHAAPLGLNQLPSSPFDSPARSSEAALPPGPALGQPPGALPTSPGSSSQGSGGSGEGKVSKGSPGRPPSGRLPSPGRLPFTPDRESWPHLRVRGSPQDNPLFDGPAEEPDVLHCPTIRHLLQPMPSPFLDDPIYTTGFVSDEDRVSLQSLLFAQHSSHAEVRRGISNWRVAQPSSAMAAAAPSLSRTLSTPRSSLDTTQDTFLDSTPRFALRAGPRSTIYFNPQKTRLAIVTAGGLCPGLNDIIRALVLKALDYGVKESNILGIRRGYKGFYTKSLKPMVLTRQAVEDIHLEGGTVLGTCESGECDVMQVVKRLDMWALDMLFVVGGQHEISSAGVIQGMCERLNVPCSVVAVPKSIDNDMLMLDKCFGYDTAVEEAQKALLAAKVEAASAYRGVGLVKLMGQHSGFIAVKAALSSGLVDVVLVPEVHFHVDAVLAHLARVLEERGHVVVCMAEGAGQERFPQQCHWTPGQDPFACKETDVGSWLKSEIRKGLHDVDVKYIDPSYLIRSIPATSDDRVHCKMLAHGALHAAFAGFTSVAIGQVSNYMVLLPLPLLAHAPRQMDPTGELWARLRAAIKMPNFDAPLE